MPAVSDSVWSAQNTTPAQIEAALRELLVERHAEHVSYVPARVLTMVVIVDRQWSGEIANRLRTVGPYHPSRTVVCSVERGRTTIDAVATIASDVHPQEGEFALTRETVVVQIGTQHLPYLETVVDPLVITDLPTLVWSPHGHWTAVEALRGMAQIVLIDSSDEPDIDESLRRACDLSKHLHVVDLAWLRSLPWRERIAGAFDPPAVRRELRQIESLEIRHHPDSVVGGLLLSGWLASRLGWRAHKLLAHREGLRGKLRARTGEVNVNLVPVPQQVRGLAGITIAAADGLTLSLDRDPGGLSAVRKTRRGGEQRFTMMGASRGEGGILGEGIRAALARDRTYAPALSLASEMIP